MHEQSNSLNLQVLAYLICWKLKMYYFLHISHNESKSQIKLFYITTYGFHKLHSSDKAYTQIQIKQNFIQSTSANVHILLTSQTTRETYQNLLGCDMAGSWGQTAVDMAPMRRWYRGRGTGLQWEESGDRTSPGSLHWGDGWCRSQFGPRGPTSSIGSHIAGKLNCPVRYINNHQLRIMTIMNSISKGGDHQCHILLKSFSVFLLEAKYKTNAFSLINSDIEKCTKPTSFNLVM